MINVRANTSGTSGLTIAWKLWRHCCCRFGWFPLLVAPLVTLSCFLDIYASLDCNFIHIDVGFIPANLTLNQSVISVGLFQYHSFEQKQLFQDIKLSGCSRYSDEFETQFVENDRTWKVTRILAYLSGASSILATVTAWLLVVTPLPASFFWPGVLLPSLLVCFVSEGSKFLFIDVAACRLPLWNLGESNTLQVAKSCRLGTTSYVAIAALVAFFLNLIIVCLYFPKKRTLDPNYGDTRIYADSGDFHPFEREINKDSKLKQFHQDESFVLLRGSGQLGHKAGSEKSQVVEIEAFDRLVDTSFILQESNSDIEEGVKICDAFHISPRNSLDNVSYETQDDGTIEESSEKTQKRTDGSCGTQHSNDSQTPSCTKLTSEPSVAGSMQRETDTESDLRIEQCVLNLTKSFQNEDFEVYEKDPETDSQPDTEPEILHINELDKGEDEGEEERNDEETLTQ